MEISICGRPRRETASISEKTTRPHPDCREAHLSPARGQSQGAAACGRGRGQQGRWRAVSRKAEAVWQKQKQLVCRGLKLSGLERENLLAECPSVSLAAGRRTPAPESGGSGPSQEGAPIYWHDQADPWHLLSSFFFALCVCFVIFPYEAIKNPLDDIVYMGESVSC